MRMQTIIDEVCDLCVGEGYDVVLFGWCPSIRDALQPMFGFERSIFSMSIRTKEHQSTVANVGRVACIS